SHRYLSRNGLRPNEARAETSLQRFSPSPRMGALRPSLRDIRRGWVLRLILRQTSREKRSTNVDSASP
ncbi:MAG: hypothetical protein ACO3JL_19725, partial [Myxococcota bacterium]